jgi:hypothetical protein
VRFINLSRLKIKLISYCYVLIKTDCSSLIGQMFNSLLSKIKELSATTITILINSRILSVKIEIIDYSK